MRIQNMFSKDIDRSINGVVKVAQNDELELKQELEEYVITDELHRRLARFIDHYNQAIDQPTDKMGVWISGFFGSGKSHFLKMLSYLLANSTVAGKTAFEYFAPKLEHDSELLSKVELACSLPCETILFNIDSKGSASKNSKTAILQVFAKVFYEHQGFYGEDLKLARLERFIDEKGKTAQFRAAWEEETGETWVDGRDSYEFEADALVDVLGAVMGMSEETVRSWIDGSETVEYSIETFTSEVREYIERRQREVGANFRLLFCVDEVGQYIGDDSDLMLNLQTIVEDLGTVCRGSAWVMVTSQQAIDEVTDKLVGNDFSKIQGRFDTRLAISGSSAAEVIRRRLLEKTPVATDTLKAEYATQEQVLKNLFTFKDARGDLIGYRSTDEFVNVFPFAGYQFDLLQSVYDGVRKHGNAGKHMSSASRSMLSGFQEAAQAVEHLDETALVPFWRFYDTLSEFLEAYISGVITRCERAAQAGDQGLNPEDVSVLKLLFLLKYVNKDMPANLNNLTILMADQVDPDLTKLRARVQESLDRLYRQNYIDRTGDTYAFLTDEEQDISREIADTEVEATDVIKAVGSAIFGDIYKINKSGKVSYGKNAFSLSCFVDNSLVGSSGLLPLRIVTDAYLTLDREPGALQLRSTDGGGECIFLLPENSGYYDNLHLAVKIERYARTTDRSSLSDTQLVILKNKNEERSRLVRTATEQLGDAILAARVFIAGSEVQVKGSSAAARIDNALQGLIQQRFTQLSLIGVNYDEGQLASIFTREDSLDGSIPNEEAVKRVKDVIQMNASVHKKTSVADIKSTFASGQFGWREVDTAACLAELIRVRDIELYHLGALVPAGDTRAIINALTNRSVGGKTEIRLRVVTDPAVLKRARDVYSALVDTNNAPADEDELAAKLRETLEDLRSTYRTWIVRYYDVRPAYPDRKLVEDAVALLGEVLGAGAERTQVLMAVSQHEDDLLDMEEDLQEVASFWTAQRKVFDQALELQKHLGSDFQTVADADAEAAEAAQNIVSILAMPQPYKSIHQLPEQVQIIENKHDALLQRAKHDAQAEVDARMVELTADAEAKDVAAEMQPRLDRARTQQHEHIEGCGLIYEVDLVLNKLDALESNCYAQIAAEQKRKQQAAQMPPTDGPGGDGPLPATPPVASVETDVVMISRSQTMPLRTLRSDAEIEAYVQRLEQELKAALKNHDEIRLVG